MSQRAVDVLLDAATAGARGEKHPAIEFLHRVNEACTRAAGALTRRVQIRRQRLILVRRHGDQRPLGQV